MKRKTVAGILLLAAVAIMLLVAFTTSGDEEPKPPETPQNLTVTFGGTPCDE